MVLAVIPKDTLIPVCFIKEYSYCTYTEQYCDRGSFEIHISDNEDSLPYLVFGNYIYLDILKRKNDLTGTSDVAVVGIIKSVKNSESTDFEIIISGYLANHLLEYRSFLVTFKKTGTIFAIAEQMVYDLIKTPTDAKRKMFVQNGESKFNINYTFILPLDLPSVTYQTTGKTLLEGLLNIIKTNGYGYFVEMNVLSNTASGTQGMAIQYVTLWFTRRKDRSINNEEGNDPVIFSFDLDNISRLDYESDGSVFCNVAIVASEGVGTERTVIDVGDTTATDVDRIELYVDARDLQSDAEYTEDYVDEQFGELLDGEY